MQPPYLVPDGTARRARDSLVSPTPFRDSVLRTSISKDHQRSHGTGNGKSEVHDRPCSSIARTAACKRTTALRIQIASFSLRVCRRCEGSDSFTTVPVLIPPPTSWNSRRFSQGLNDGQKVPKRSDIEKCRSSGRAL